MEVFMSENKSKEREELEKAIGQLKDIQKGNTSSEVVNAIIKRITEDTSEDEKVARPSSTTDEIQPNM